MDSWMVRLFGGGFVWGLVGGHWADRGQVGQAPSSCETRCGVEGERGFEQQMGRALKGGGRVGRI
jgi:hypothetical protein